MTELVLSDTTTEFSEFVSEFTALLATKDTWKGNLTIQTSQTLIELISTIGAFDNAKLLRYFEDCFSETVQSTKAIHAIAVMQGIRLTRKMPACVSVSLTSSDDEATTLSPYTQINVGGQYFFNREAITIEPGATVTASLFQGEVSIASVSGLGTNFQVFMSQADGFAVSDQDVIVVNNQVILPKAYGGLWNYKGRDGYSDLTHADGRLMIQFGSTAYGTVPQVNDQLVVIYVTTLGADGNALTIKGNAVTIDGYDLITGSALNNPTGGADQKDPLTYKNIEAGAAGAFSSAVTRDQYRALVVTYPGVIDAITQAQREINPMKKEWMNVIRVSALTNSEWTAAQKREFCAYAQSVSMYSPYFLWQDPVPVYRDIEMNIYCYNTAIPSVVKKLVYAAITKMFSPQAGLLMTNFYPSDLDACARKAAPGAVSYVEIVSPAGNFIVTAPPSPEVEAEIVHNGGSLTPLVYAYGISVVNTDGEEGQPTNWVFPQVTGTVLCGVTLKWEKEESAAHYKIWGRKAGSIGLLTTLDATHTQWTDDGSAVSDGTNPMSGLADIPIRYNALRTLTVNAYFADRQQRFGS